MSVIVDLTPEVEDRLAVLAREQGLSLSSYLARLVTETLPDRARLSASERARLWRESVPDSSCKVVLSDEAMSRDSFYGSRG